MSMFTCITCRVAFADADVQRAHYKTDWHRYNLKRKVAELPPVTAENFQERVLTQRAQASEQSKDESSHCSLCNKHFSSKNAYDNHVKSKKHQEAEVKVNKKLKDEVQKRNEKNETKGIAVLDENEKLLRKDAANKALKDTLAKSGSEVKGQSEGASSSRSKVTDDMDVDEEDEDVDSDEWDENTVGLEECLFCSHISKTMEDNLQHMSYKHGFFIPDAEYVVDIEEMMTYLGEKVGVGRMCLWCSHGDKGRMFPTLRAAQQHMIDKCHCKIFYEGDDMLEYADFYDYRSSYPDYDADADADDEDNDEEVAIDQLGEENYQLVLPSGSTIGHRSLMKYYKQNYGARRVQNKTAMSKVMAQYKAIGWIGATGEAARKRAKDIGYVQKLKAKHYMKMGVKNNSFQKHFRPQVVF